MVIEVATIFWIELIVAGLLAVLFLAFLILLGSPSTNEPRFIKAMRFNMWAETLGLFGYLLRNPRLLSYRAKGIEKKMSIPGDELVPTANASATYAITINSPAKSIWPWLLQMGYGRALWYAWSPMHAFPEFKQHISPCSIHPEWQSLHEGDILLDGDALDQCNENRGAWRVIKLHENRAIVLISARDFIEGIEFDPQTIRPNKIFGIISWVFYLRPVNEKQSRLLIRTRAELGPGLLKIVAKLVFGCMDAVFERAVLEGIKYRVENFTKTYNI